VGGSSAVAARIAGADLGRGSVADGCFA